MEDLNDLETRVPRGRSCPGLQYMAVEPVLLSCMGCGAQFHLPGSYLLSPFHLGLILIHSSQAVSSSTLLDSSRGSIERRGKTVSFLSVLSATAAPVAGNVLFSPRFEHPQHGWTLESIQLPNCPEQVREWPNLGIFLQEQKKAHIWLQLLKEKVVRIFFNMSKPIYFS